MTAQINIVANGPADFTTASVGKRLVAVRWRVADRWYVAALAAEPQGFDDEGDAVRAFFGAAMEASK